MNCREIEHLIPAWMENDCSAVEHSLVESHLGGCPACREAVEEFRQLDVALLSRRDEIPRASRTFHAVMARTRQQRTKVVLDRLLSVPSLSTFLVLVVATALFIYRDSVEALFSRDIQLQGSFAGAAQQMIDALVSVSGGDIWALSILYGGVTLVILLAMGLTVQNVLRSSNA